VRKIYIDRETEIVRERERERQRQRQKERERERYEQRTINK